MNVLRDALRFVGVDDPGLLASITSRAQRLKLATLGSSPEYVIFASPEGVWHANLEKTPPPPPNTLLPAGQVIMANPCQVRGELCPSAGKTPQFYAFLGPTKVESLLYAYQYCPVISQTTPTV